MFCAPPDSRRRPGFRRRVLADPDGNDVGLMSPIDQARRMWPPQESPVACELPARLVMLVAAGRRTGKTVSFPVVVAGYQGERYLVSMLGEGTNWAGHVRAGGGHAAPRPR